MKKKNNWLCLPCFALNTVGNNCHGCGLSEKKEHKQSGDKVRAHMKVMDRLKEERGRGNFECEVHGSVPKYLTEPVLIRFGCEVCYKTELKNYQDFICQPIDFGR